MRRRYPLSKLNPKISSPEGYGQSDFGAITPSDVAAAAHRLSDLEYNLVQYRALYQRSEDLFDRIVRAVFAAPEQFVDRNGLAWRLGKGQIKRMIEVALADLSNPKKHLQTEIYEMCGFTRDVWYSKNRYRYKVISNIIDSSFRDGVRKILSGRLGTNTNHKVE